MDNFLSRLKNLSAHPESRSNRPEGSASGRESAESSPPDVESASERSSLARHLQRKRQARKSGDRRQNRPPLNFPGKAAIAHAGHAVGTALTFYQKQPRPRKLMLWAALVATGGGAVLAYGYWSIERTLPATGDLSGFVRDGTLTIKAADGSVLQQLGPATREKLALNQIPDRVAKAFIAAEDRRFYQHHGVDVQSIVRAVGSNLLARDVVEGGSTITQQLARVVYLNQDRSMWRKLQEAFMAQKIERELSKDQVLEKYLNFVYLGSSAYGVADAAWIYFSKPVDKLTLSEMATIAGLPPAPSEYSPLVNLKLAQERRDIVLARMQEEGYISAAEAQAAKSQPLKLKPSLPKKLYSDTPYFTSYVQQELRKYVSKEQLELGGLTVETTLNPRWQKRAEQVVKETVQDIGPAEGFEQAALVSIDPKNGEIRAMIGGTDFKNSQFNRATQAQRQPGSSFKPILYTTAIATGISPTDGYLDAPFSVDGYKPQNYGRKYSGWMTLRDALTNSVNVISVKLIIDVGFEPVIKMAQAMGIKSKLLPAYSLALGASEVNLLEMTEAYGTLANKGKHVETHGIRRITNRKGEVLYEANFQAKPAVDPGSVAIVTWMMEKVVNSGTGQAAQLDRPVAGKTGTSENARDLWFIGFVPQLVTGIWLGNDDNYPTASASSTAAYTWHKFMVSALQGMPVEDFPAVPPLDGRKGSIKAKPITPGRFYNEPMPPGGRDSGNSDSNSNGGSSSGGGYSDGGYSGGGYSGGGDSGGGYSGGGSSEPQPAAPAPAAEPAPAPAPAAEPAPPPENSAPVPPAPEPTPAAPSEPAPAKGGV